MEAASIMLLFAVVTLICTVKLGRDVRALTAHVDAHADDWAGESWGVNRW